MRVWDIPPKRLCNRHLLAEHRELHAIWVIITEGRSGYSRHPETLRWHGKLKALYLRHDREVAEFARRGFRHKSPLVAGLAVGKAKQDDFINKPREQARILRSKKCGCKMKVHRHRMTPAR